MSGKGQIGKRYIRKRVYPPELKTLKSLCLTRCSPQIYQHIKLHDTLVSPLAEYDLIIYENTATAVLEDGLNTSIAVSGGKRKREKGV